LDALRKVYESKGYINFTPVPNAQVDDAAHTISLMVDIDEGVQFRIGTLVLDGVEAKPGAGAKVLENWKQYEGQIYAPQVVEQFLRENSAILPAGVSSLNFIAQPDEQAHILNFRLDLPTPPS
jgi:outer membrane protein assembly factor BamA